MAQRPPDGTQARPATTLKRAEILRAAIETFGAKGSTNGTLSDVAEQVGMTHAGVLHHFGSKNNLLLEVLRYRDRADVEEFADQHVPRGPALFLHLVRTAYANAQRPGIVQVFTVLSSESVTEGHAARDYFEDRYHVLRNDLLEAFEVLCAQEGVTDTRTVTRAASAIIAVMDGLQLQWLLDPTAFDLGETTAFAITAIVHEILTPGLSLDSYVRDTAPESSGT